MKKRPVIGLNMSLASIADEDRWELQAPLNYVDAVTGAGGLPLLVPPYEDPAMIPQAASLLDGILFIGGADYRPHHYGGHAQPEKELMPARRDLFDVNLARWILQETSLPVLAICGGHQLIAIVQGGELIQDIRTEWTVPEGSPSIPHAKSERPDANPADFRHVVRMKPRSLISGALGSPAGDCLETNSYHHQSVHPGKPGRSLFVSAWTNDGVVEAIEPRADCPWGRSGRFVLGVQWHPERMQHEEPHRRLFSALVAAAERYRRR